jgi:hypothetical protein
MNRAVIVALVAILNAAAASAAGQAHAPLVVAYMTSDGELVPIARYNGTVWRNTWPEPIENGAPLPVRTVSEIPTGWLGQRVPLSWTAWSLATGKQQRVSVTGVDRDGSCVEAITLTTNFKPNPASDGLAFSRPTMVDAIVEVEQGSREQDSQRREVASHFRTAIAEAVPPRPGSEQSEIGTKVFALARADKLADDAVVLESVFRDPRFPVFFIEAQRRFDVIPPGTDYDALSYGGWFSRDRAGALVAISASLASFSTAEGKLPRYTPIGILRLGAGSIWVMSEWGKESHTIVLFEITATGVKKLTSADISGC